MYRRDFIISTIAALGGVATMSRPVRAAENNGVLRIALFQEVLTLDPIKTVYPSDIVTQGIMFSRLLRTNSNQSEYMSGLADSWEVSGDGKTYTFTLRDAKFSDGTEITAEDVAFSYNRMRFQKDSAYAGPYHALQKIEATGPKTVVMELDQSFTPFPTLTEIWNSGIVPKKYVEEVGDEVFGREPVTSGPFRFVEWRRGDRVVLEANPHYYRDGSPNLKGVEILYVPDDNTRLNMLQADEVDVIMGVPAPRVKGLVDLGFRADPEPASVTYDMLINHEVEPFNDLRVRKAVNIGIDRATIVQVVTSGYGQPASSVMAPTLDYFNDSLNVPQRDVAKAKALLAEAGKENLSFDLMIAAGVEDDERTAVIIQSQLADAGVTVNILKVDSTQSWTRLVEGDYQATLNWWYSETPDPDIGLRWAVWGAGENQSYYTRFNNERVNELLDQGVLETADDKRRQIYHEIQQICYDEVSQIALYYPPYYNAYGAAVKNLQLNPGYQFADIDQTKFA